MSIALFTSAVALSHDETYWDDYTRCLAEAQEEEIDCLESAEGVMGALVCWFIYDYLACDPEDYVGTIAL